MRTGLAVLLALLSVVKDGGSSDAGAAGTGTPWMDGTVMLTVISVTCLIDGGADCTVCGNGNLNLLDGGQVAVPIGCAEYINTDSICSQGLSALKAKLGLGK